MSFSLFFFFSSNFPLLEFSVPDTPPCPEQTNRYASHDIIYCCVHTIIFCTYHTDCNTGLYLYSYVFSVLVCIRMDGCSGYGMGTAVLYSGLTLSYFWTLCFISGLTALSTLYSTFWTRPLLFTYTWILYCSVLYLLVKMDGWMDVHTYIRICCTAQIYGLSTTHTHTHTHSLHGNDMGDEAASIILNALKDNHTVKYIA